VTCNSRGAAAGSNDSKMPWIGMVTQRPRPTPRWAAGSSPWPSRPWASPPWSWRR